MVDIGQISNRSCSSRSESLGAANICLSCMCTGSAHQNLIGANKSEFVQELSDAISDVEGKLQIILVKQKELSSRALSMEREKLDFEHKLQQKSELFEQLNKTMQAVSQQSNTLIQAQMERISYLESSLESERKAHQNLKESFSEKKAECLMLQQALDELEKEKIMEQEKIKSSMYLKAEEALSKKMDAERKIFLKELEKVQEHVKLDLMRREELNRSNEYQELRAALIHLQSTCSVYDDLIIFLEGHTDRAGFSKIRETYQKLHLASRIFISSLTTKSMDHVDDFSKYVFGWMEKRCDTARSIENAAPEYSNDSGHGSDGLSPPYPDERSGRTNHDVLEGLSLDLEALKHHNTRRWNSASLIYDGTARRR